jgi:hypothetical protein
MNPDELAPLKLLIRRFRVGQVWANVAPAVDRDLRAPPAAEPGTARASGASISQVPGRAKRAR